MTLPECHSRRFLQEGPNVFYCAHPLVHAAGQRVTAEICRMCAYWREPAPQTFRPFPPPPPRGPCAYLGAQTGLRDCRDCRGRVKLFACAHPVHGETTLAECATCPDFKELPAARTETPTPEAEAPAGTR